MSDGSLSQEEIDALLSGTGGLDFAAPAPGDSGAEAEGFTDAEKKAFQTFLNSTVAAQGSNLSGVMATKTVSIKNPKIEILSRDGIIENLPDEIVEVKIDYTGGVSGSHSYVLDTESASTMASIIVGQDQVELNEMALEALKEAFSTLTGVFLTSLGDKLGSSIMPTPGESSSHAKDQLSMTDDTIVQVTYPLKLEGEADIKLVEFFELSMAKNIAAQLSPAAASGPKQVRTQPQGAAAGGMQQSPPQTFQQQGMQGGQGMTGYGMGMNQSGPNVQPVQFPSLNPGHGHSSDMGNISLLMDVYMEMTVELGRTKKPIREILGMGEGTIIELDKLAGEPVDILVNHKLIATGEVVVIDENFGVRVTEIVSPNERIKDL
ncbi:MAG: flagellar motor switch phosphatase FliY [Spirochaetales bacterium]|nr:MAG: flagellar motor switch phosphatase FliY [Spirochaetales bacterium]